MSSEPPVITDARPGNASSLNWVCQGLQDLDAGTRLDLLAAIEALGSGPAFVFSPGVPAHTQELYERMKGYGSSRSPLNSFSYERDWEARRAEHLAALPASVRTQHRRVLSPVSRILGVDWKALLLGLVSGDLAVVVVLQPVLERAFGRFPGDTFLELAVVAGVVWFTSKTVERWLRRRRWVQARDLGIAGLAGDPEEHLD